MKFKELKIDKSPRPDSLYRSAFKQVSLEIVTALMIIFQNDLDFWSVPVDHWVGNIKKITI